MILFCNSMFAEGEKCSMCSAPAAHKVAEEQFSDDPNNGGQRIRNAQAARHDFTAYLCCKCFTVVMGPAAVHSSNG